MSRVDDLLAELAPDGIPFARLGELVRIRNGRDFKHLAVGPVPVYGTGGVMSHVAEALSPGPTVLIPRKGSLDKLYYVDGPVWTVDTIFYTDIGERIDPRFLYHVLLRRKLRDLNQAGGVPSLTQSVLNELKIPVPPLEVQREIARVLNELTVLEAKLKLELEAELEARRAQFAHYRNALFSFADLSLRHVRWIRMGDVGTFARGRRFVKTDVADVGVPGIHYGEIYTDYGISAKRASRRVRSEIRASLRFAHPGDVIFAGVGETVEDVGKPVAWLGEEPVAFHDDTFAFKSELNPEYVAHTFHTDAFQAQKNNHVARGKVKRLSSAGLAQIRIPVPDRAEQDRIVVVLNEMDALVNDLSIGLPAELQARRKQYEYYRDKLLTFKEAA